MPFQRFAGAALSMLLSAACTGGSSSPTVGDPLPAPPVSAELAVSGDGVQMLSDDGAPLETVKLPSALLEADSAAWSPDGTRVAFTAGVRSTKPDALLPPTDVYSVNLAGGTPLRLTTDHDAVFPSWSPDGRWIAYTAVRKIGGERSAGISVIHPDGSGGQQLTPARRDVFDIAGPYNPVSGRLAFTRCTRTPSLAGGLEPDTCSVWTMAPDGSDQRRLAAESEQPSWSPDGRRIVFASARDHAGQHMVGEDNVSWNRQLYVMNRDGSDQRRLITTGSDDEHPTWAPGGAVVAYQTSTRKTYQTTLALVNADGSCRLRIPPPAAPALNSGYSSPAWRPGGVAAPLVC
jgi:dipeptidyl aminopeptidase/acylaminoacyl peptidase